MANLRLDLIVTRNGYGFGHDWQLKVAKGKKVKIFYLGQDVKVCHRVLGMKPSDVAAEVGSNDLRLLKTRKAIAKMILEAYGITGEKENQLFEVQPWELAAE